MHFIAVLPVHLFLLPRGVPHPSGSRGAGFTSAPAGAAIPASPKAAARRVVVGATRNTAGASAAGAATSVPWLAVQPHSFIHGVKISLK